MSEGPGSPWRDVIWSPWRIEYIRKERPVGCVFCEIAGADPADDGKNYVLHRGRTQFVLLNRWPYNNGHLMVIPFRHIRELAELTDEEALESFHLARRVVDAFRRSMRAEGVNMGYNLGRVSGGSIDHLHLHLVPRWSGDSNFMPVISGTKVLVEMLDDTYSRLRDEVRGWSEEE